MGYYCTVPQCTSLAGKTKNVKFHRFPRDESMADSWNIILKRGKPYTKYSKVCSLHFTPGDYNVTSMGQWKTLNKDAIPTQNLPRLNPDGTVMVIRKSRSPKHRSDTSIVKSNALNSSMDSVYTPNKSDWGVKSSSPDMSGIDYTDDVKSSQTPSTSMSNLQKQSRDSLESLNSETPLPLDNKSAVSKRDASFLNDKSVCGKRNLSFLNDSSSFNYHRPHEDENEGMRSEKGSPENYKIAKLNLKEENNESSHSSSIYSNGQTEYDSMNLLHNNEQANSSNRQTNSELPNFYTQRVKEEVEIELDLINRNNEQNIRKVVQNGRKVDQDRQTLDQIRRNLQNSDTFPQGLEQTIMLQQQREIFERLRREEQLMKGEFFMRNRIKDEPDSGIQDSQGLADQNSSLPMAPMYFNSENGSVPSYYKQRDDSEIMQDDLKQQKEEQIRQIQKKLKEDALRQRQEREEQLKKWQQDDILRQQRQQEEALSQRQQQQDHLRQQEEALRQRQEDILRQQRLQEALQRQQEEALTQRQQQQELLRLQEENLRRRQEELLRQQQEDVLRQQDDSLSQREQQDLLRQQEENLRNRQEEVLRQQQEGVLRHQEDVLRQRQQQEDLLIQQQEEALRQQEDMLRQRQEDEIMQQQQEEVLRQQEDMLRQQQEDMLRQQQDDMLNQQQIFRQRAEEMLEEDILRQHEENLRQRHAQQQELLRKQDDLLRQTQEELLRDRQQNPEDSLMQQEDMLRQQGDVLGQNQHEEALRQHDEALRQQDEALRQQDEALRQQEDLISQRQQEENMLQEQILQQQMSHQQLGPEQLIAKQNALAAHTGLWQNSVKRPFFYSEAQQFNTAQLFQNRYEDIARLLNQ